MDETVNEIEAHIDRTRDRLSSNWRELEDKVDAATDWRGQFRRRPYLFLGAAFAGGAVLGGALKRRAPEAWPKASSSPRRPGQVGEIWNHMQAALVSVASAQVRNFIGQLLPGFDEHYRRAEQRAAAVDPGATPLGRTPDPEWHEQRH